MLGPIFWHFGHLFQASLEEKATDMYAEGMQHYRHRRFSEVPWPRSDQVMIGYDWEVLNQFKHYQSHGKSWKIP